MLTFINKSILAAVVLTTVLVVPASAQFGVAAGLNFEEFGDIETQSIDATFENAIGYHFGVFYDLGITSFSVRPGIFFRSVQNLQSDVLSSTESFDLNMLEVPLDLRVKLMSGFIITPYLSVGPVVTFASSSNQDFDEAIQDLYVAANASAGFELGLGGMRLYPEFRYGFGLTSITSSDEPFSIGNANFTPTDGSTVNSFMLRLGVGF